MQFQVRAISPDGRFESIDLAALDESSVRQQVSTRGYTVVSVRRRAGGISWASRARSEFPVLLFSQELLALLNAGLPLVEAIEALAEKESDAGSREVLHGVVRLVSQGRPLSAALEQYPAAFNTLYVATTRASERTSDLAPALSRFIGYRNRVDAVRKQLVNASIYPALLLAVGTLVTLFLLLYVVPRFGKLYDQRSTNLPALSQLLLLWGRTIEGHAYAVIGALGALVGLCWYGVRQPRVREGIARGLWAVPAIGDRLKVYQLARFYRTTAMLLRGGTPLVSALESSAELLQPALRARLAVAIRAISTGQPVSDSMARNGLTTSVALRLLAVGEQGGDMGEMMDHIATFYDEDLSRWADRFTRVFEPLLMAFIGITIGAIVILMYMPIFELAGSLQ